MISSKQNEEDYSSSGFGFNFGVGVGSSGKDGNVGGGFNISNADMHRLWTDNITTIKSTDSMAVNVGKDLNLTGAAILSDNLALAVNGNTNKKELQDSYYRESMGFGFSRNFTTNGSQPTIPGTGGKPNTTPGGSTTISGNYSQNESSRTVYATIGSLSATTLDDSDPNKLRLTSSTNSMIGADFEGSLTLDHRLFSEAGRSQIGKELNESIEVGKIVLPKVWASPNTALGLTLGGVGYLYGAATGQDVKVSIGNNAVQFEGNPLASGGAITLGNAINYFGTARTNSIYPTYESNNENWSGGANYDSVILGGHEVKHTYQAEMLGPLFLPTYFFSGVGGAAANSVITINPINQYNPMERSADIVGNQSLKQQKNEN